jgi:hypothetical protein
MDDKNAEVYELRPVPPAGQPTAASKDNAAPSQSRGLKVGKIPDYDLIPQFWD